MRGGRLSPGKTKHETKNRNTRHTLKRAQNKILVTQEDLDTIKISGDGIGEVIISRRLRFWEIEIEVRVNGTRWHQAGAGAEERALWAQLEEIAFRQKEERRRVREVAAHASAKAIFEW